MPRLERLRKGSWAPAVSQAGAKLDGSEGRLRQLAPLAFFRGRSRRWGTELTYSVMPGCSGKGVA